MSTAAVLQPQDFNNPINTTRCVQRSMPVVSHKSQRRRRSPVDDEKRSVESVRKVLKNVTEVKDLVMEKVRILKRGEIFMPNSNPKLSPNLVKCSATDQQFDDTKLNVIEKKGVVVDGFAGGGFIASAPLPSNLPMPKRNWLGRGTLGLDMWREENECR